MKLDTDSLTHTQWNCKYHIVFAPKYRRQIIYGKIRADIGTILRKLCEYKGVEIIEAEACPDHIHMLISIPPKYSVSKIMGYLKGKTDNDGFSESNPLCDYKNLDLKEGDTVLFKRGTFIRGKLYNKNGVTYGAYGEGENPTFCGSVDLKTTYGKKRKRIYGCIQDNLKRKLVILYLMEKNVEL